MVFVNAAAAAVCFYYPAPIVLNTEYHRQMTPFLWLGRICPFLPFFAWRIRSLWSKVVPLVARTFCWVRKPRRQFFPATAPLRCASLKKSFRVFSASDAGRARGPVGVPKTHELLSESNLVQYYLFLVRQEYHGGHQGNYYVLMNGTNAYTTVQTSTSLLV